MWATSRQRHQGARRHPFRDALISSLARILYELDHARQTQEAEGMYEQGLYFTRAPELSTGARPRVIDEKMAEGGRRVGGEWG